MESVIFNVLLFAFVALTLSITAVVLLWKAF